AANVVLTAAREALGGDKKLSAVKTIVATGRTRQVRGENLVPIEFEIAIELPDKYVRKDEIPAQESEPTTVGFSGEELIQFPVPTLPTMPMPQRAGGPPAPTAASLDAARKARLANVKQDFARLTLGMFAGSFPGFPVTFSYVAKAEAPQGKADVLEVKGPANFAARLFVNAETHLPVMVTWTPPAPPQRGGPPPQRGSGPPSPAAASPATAGQVPQAGREGQPGGRGPAPGPASPPPESRIYYADYRDVNGMQFPFRLRRAVGPDTIEETTFDGFKINSKIDPKKFEVRK
ncbi:MAG: hypothetical protein DMF91_23990, partial [Acidobacteria bacterium]